MRLVQLWLDTATGNACRAQFVLIWLGQTMNNEKVMGFERLQPSIDIRL